MHSNGGFDQWYCISIKQRPNYATQDSRIVDDSNNFDVSFQMFVEKFIIDVIQTNQS